MDPLRFFLIYATERKLRYGKTVFKTIICHFLLNSSINTHWDKNIMIINDSQNWTSRHIRLKVFLVHKVPILNMQINQYNIYTNVIFSKDKKPNTHINKTKIC